MENNENVMNEKNKEQKQEELLRKYIKGRLELVNPIRAAGRDVNILNWNFDDLTGSEYIEAMDNIGGNSNAFRVSNEQALNLFCAAAAKATNKTMLEKIKQEKPEYSFTQVIDPTTIRSQIAPRDCIKAVQIATFFFNLSSRVGDANMSGW